VLASWYGPGFYGNRTACGQTYTPELLGVAHLTLACGTPVTLTYGSRSVRVTVIDRGPYVTGRAIDLSNATKLALACTDLCTLRMQIAR
jgi:rare lipoprotein A